MVCWREKMELNWEKMEKLGMLENIKMRLNRITEIEVEEERVAAEQKYWDSIGYYDKNGNWKEHKKILKAKRRSEKQAKKIRS